MILDARLRHKTVYDINFFVVHRPAGRLAGWLIEK